MLTFHSPVPGVDLVLSVGGYYNKQNLKYVTMYNVQLGIWTLMKDLPFATRFMQNFVLDSSRLHILGGIDAVEGLAIREYDWINDQWIETGHELGHNYKNGLGLVYNV